VCVFVKIRKHLYKMIYNAFIFLCDYETVVYTLTSRELPTL
jgi:hypothetical protein